MHYSTKNLGGSIDLQNDKKIFKKSYAKLVTHAICFSINR